MRYFKDVKLIVSNLKTQKAVFKIVCDEENCDWEYNAITTARSFLQKIEELHNKPCPSCKVETPIDDVDYRSAKMYVRVVVWLIPFSVAKTLVKYVFSSGFRKQWREETDLARERFGTERVNVRLDSKGLKQDKYPDAEFATITPKEVRDEG